MSRAILSIVTLAGFTGLGFILLNVCKPQDTSKIAVAKEGSMKTLFSRKQ